jgi:hypothetical protein
MAQRLLVAFGAATKAGPTRQGEAPRWGPFLYSEFVLVGHMKRWRPPIVALLGLVLPRPGNSFLSVTIVYCHGIHQSVVSNRASCPVWAQPAASGIGAGPAVASTGPALALMGRR